MKRYFEAKTKVVEAVLNSGRISIHSARSIEQEQELNRGAEPNISLVIHPNHDRPSTSQNAQDESTRSSII